MTVLVAAAESGSTVKVIDSDGETRRDEAAMGVLGAVEERLK